MDVLDPAKVAAAESQLYQLLGTELTAIIEAVTTKRFMVELPETYSVDGGVEQLGSLVARAANTFSTAARFAGIARAEAKLARGRYDRKSKRSRQGRNEAERDETAMTAAHDEHVAFTTAEAVAELAGAMESAARVASESARKLLSSVENQLIAERRGAKGTLRDEDFTRQW